MNRHLIRFSRICKKQLVSIFLLLLSLSTYSQYKINFGLSQPQERPTLPASVVKPVISVRKAKVAVPADIQKVSENEYILSSGWELAEADQVTSASLSLFSPNFNTAGWYNATVPGTVLTTLVDQGVYPDPYFG